MRWWEDPRTARTLGRMTWLVLVAGFVLGTRFAGSSSAIEVGGWALSGRHGVAALLVVVVAVMSFPTALGLHHTRAQSHLRAYRWLLLSFLARIVATGWVVWMLVSLR